LTDFTVSRILKRKSGCESSHADSAPPCGRANQQKKGLSRIARGSSVVEFFRDGMKDKPHRRVGICTKCGPAAGPQILYGEDDLCSRDYQRDRRRKIKDLKVPAKVRLACWQRLHAAGGEAHNVGLFSPSDFSLFRELIDPILPFPAPGRENDAELEIEKVNGVKIYRKGEEYFTSLEPETMFESLDDARAFILSQSGDDSVVH
jgi:hypothetical protein